MKTFSEKEAMRGTVSREEDKGEAVRRKGTDAQRLNSYVSKISG